MFGPDHINICIGVQPCIVLLSSLVKGGGPFNFVPQSRGGSCVFYSGHFQMLWHTPTPPLYFFTSPLQCIFIKYSVFCVAYITTLLGSAQKEYVSSDCEKKTAFSFLV